MNLPDCVKNKIQRRVPLAPRTSLRVGGKAGVWYEPADAQELALFLREKDPRLGIFVIGAGSNLLVRDGTLDKVFVHLAAPAFTRLKVRGTEVKVGAGVKIGRLVSKLLTRDLGGYEFLAGIPGTIGGALVMNAGARVKWDDPASNRSMADIVSRVEVMDACGRRRVLEKKEISFAYRSSSLKPYIILEATLRLRRADRKRVQETVSRAVKMRYQHQDWQHPSAGSFFKNPPREAAARLIDRCGLKGREVGGARVSARHANFIINAGGASASDVLKLVEIIKKKVYNRFHIKLEPEVEIVS